MSTILSLNAAYLVASIASASCAVVSVGRAWSANGRTWLGISAILLALEILRLNQVASWLDLNLQHVFLTSGLYPYRRPLQLALIIVAAAAASAWLTQKGNWTNRPLVIGEGATFTLMITTATRAASLHWTDSILEARLAGLTLSHLVQVICLAILCACAVWQLVARAKLRGRA